MPEITLDAYRAIVGQEVGVSRWLDVPQERIDAFADVTDDRMHPAFAPDVEPYLEKIDRTASRETP